MNFLFLFLLLISAVHAAKFFDIITLKPQLNTLDINQLHQLLLKSQSITTTMKSTAKKQETKQGNKKTSEENFQSFFDARISKSPTMKSKNKINNKLEDF